MSTTNHPLHQPVSDLQLRQLVVEWVSHATITPNAYNPNRMTAHDRALLRQSLLEDGWTQPIVTLPDGTIVDGEQRWTTAGLPLHTSDIDAIIAKMEKRREQGFVVSDSILERLHESRRRLAALEAQGQVGTLAALTGGLVPITRVDFKDDAHKMLSTIRHNRARGTHSLDSMAAIAQDLKQMGLDFDDLETRLGMDDEEIRRLLEVADLPDQLAEQLNHTPSSAWHLAHLSELDDDALAQRELARSRAAAEEAKHHQQRLLERHQAIERQQAERIAQLQAETNRPLTQDQKAQLAREIAAALPVPERPKPPELRKLVFLVTLPEYDLIMRVLGEPPVEGLVTLCRTAQTWKEAGDG